MKALQIVEAAYRGTIEEQDDTIVWLSHAMKGAGGELDVLLRADAANYAVRGQDASGFHVGSWHQTQPPRIDNDVAALLPKGIKVYAVAEDADNRGIPAGDMVDGVELVARAGLPQLFAGYDQIWHW
jgi:hypothetical protein